MRLGLKFKILSILAENIRFYINAYEILAVYYILFQINTFIPNQLAGKFSRNKIIINMQTLQECQIESRFILSNLNKEINKHRLNILIIRFEIHVVR